MSEDVRPFEEYKEMIKDMRKEEMIKGLYDLSKNITEKGEEIKRLNIIINRIKSIYSSLCFSAPENNYIFIEQLGEVLQELKGSDKK